MLIPLLSLANLIKHIFYQEFFKRRIGLKKNEVLIISSTGIGDLYLKLLLVKALKRFYQVDKVSVGVVKSKHLEITNMFSTEVYKSYLLTEQAVQAFSTVTLPNNRVFHPYHQPVSRALFSSIGINGFHFFDAIKLMMRLPLNAEIFLPTVPIEYMDSARTKFKAYELLEGKTILLAPHAVTAPAIDEQFWYNLIDLGLAKGYKIAMMSDSLQVNHPDVVQIDINLGAAIPFVEQCGVFIGLRSGFCDLVSSAKAKKVIVYPQISYDGSNQPYLAGFNFQSLPFIDQTTFLEIELPADLNQLFNFVQRK